MFGQKEGTKKNRLRGNSSSPLLTLLRCPEHRPHRGAEPHANAGWEESGYGRGSPDVGGGGQGRFCGGYACLRYGWPVFCDSLFFFGAVCCSFLEGAEKQEPNCPCYFATTPRVGPLPLSRTWRSARDALRPLHLRHAGPGSRCHPVPLGSRRRRTRTRTWSIFLGDILGISSVCFQRVGSRSVLLCKKLLEHC